MSADESSPERSSALQQQREQMVQDTIARRGIHDARVLAAMSRVPRHLFVPDHQRALAYADRALPIASGQTISQPFVVAAMTAAAEIAPTDRCLEIGTGSGYQTAVLLELAAQVFSIEFLPDVARLGADNLRRAGYADPAPDSHRRAPMLRTGDGYRGWPEAAPFDVILVTAACAEPPKPLLQQLALGGRLVIPIGPVHAAQTLRRYRRTAGGLDRSAFEQTDLYDVRFVPFLGQQTEGN